MVPSAPVPPIKVEPNNVDKSADNLATKISSPPPLWELSNDPATIGKSADLVIPIKKISPLLWSTTKLWGVSSSDPPK